MKKLLIVAALAAAALVGACVEADSQDASSNAVDQDTISSETPTTTTRQTTTTTSPYLIRNGLKIWTHSTERSPIPMREFGIVGYWQVEVLSIVDDATRTVLNENQFNEAPPSGWRYALVQVRLTNIDEEFRTPWLEVDFSALANDGRVGTECGEVIPGEVDTLQEIPPGGSIQGNVCVIVPAGQSFLLITGGDDIWTDVAPNQFHSTR